LGKLLLTFPETTRLLKKTTNWKPDWRNPTQESVINKKVNDGANEKPALAVLDHTERSSMEGYLSRQTLLTENCSTPF
jgi:hypothetical protein